MTAVNIKMLPAQLFAGAGLPAHDGRQDVRPMAAQTASALSPLTKAAAAPAASAQLRLKPRIHDAIIKAALSGARGVQEEYVPDLVPNARFYLCTVIDKSYLIKALTQYRSLENTLSDFHIFVCCTDDDAYRIMRALKLPRCTPLSLRHIGDSALYKLQRERKANEFCWTLKSYLMLYLLRERGLAHVLYCDGDIGFMGSLSLLYQDWGDSAIYICRQRDVDWVEKKYGKYQAGIVGVKNNETGLRMLRWWRDKCREWCFSYEDNGRLGDQKYLDDVPELFGDVKISANKGINAAPWNTIYNNNAAVAASGSRVTIDGTPLVAYHFACIDIYDAQHYDLWSLGRITIQPVVRKAIYVPYLKMLRKAMSAITAVSADMKPPFIDKSFEEAKTPFILSKKNLQLLDWDHEYAFCTICSQTYTARTLALHSSIRRFLSNFHMWICCSDDAAYAVLSRFGLENTTLLRVSEVETPEILTTRQSKSVAEYCWTLKPALCSYVFAHYNVNRLLYCDSDIYFFSHPRPIHELWNNYATLLNRQLGTPALEHRHGMYQAGMIGFSKAAESLEILRWWQRKCTEWCYDDHSTDDRWGDQKYLQRIPDLFSSIRVNDRYGLVAAPWNIVMNNTQGLKVSRAGRDVYLDNEKLVAYHFGSINMLSENTFDLWKHEPLKFDRRVLEYIYTPYLKHLGAICEAIAAKGPGSSMLYQDTGHVQNPFSVSAPKEADSNAQLIFADR